MRIPGGDRAVVELSKLSNYVLSPTTAEWGLVDGYGARYVLDFWLSGPEGRALVRSIWIVRVGEDFPRLVTMYLT